MPEVATVSALALTGLRAFFGSLVQVRQEAPGQHVQMPFPGFGMPPYDERGLGRREVPARTEIRDGVHRPEQASNRLGWEKAGVATTQATYLGSRRRTRQDI